jgi:hypothetical protein
MIKACYILDYPIFNQNYSTPIYEGKCSKNSSELVESYEFLEEERCQNWSPDSILKTDKGWSAFQPFPITSQTCSEDGIRAKCAMIKQIRLANTFASQCYTWNLRKVLWSFLTQNLTVKFKLEKS